MVTFFKFRFKVMGGDDQDWFVHESVQLFVTIEHKPQKIYV